MSEVEMDVCGLLHGSPHDNTAQSRLRRMAQHLVWAGDEPALRLGATSTCGTRIAQVHADLAVGKDKVNLDEGATD